MKAHAELRIEPEILEPPMTGLLYGQVCWKPGTFGPLTHEEVAEFYEEADEQSLRMNDHNSALHSDQILNHNRVVTKASVQEAKTQLSRYLDMVEAGETVVICRHNKPVAELRRIEPEVLGQPTPGLLQGQVHWEPGTFDPMTNEELAEFDGPVLSRETSA